MRWISAFVVAAFITIIPTTAAPRPIAELVLDVPWATAFVGEPIDCTLRIRGPRIDEKIFAQHPEYVPVGMPPATDEGFAYRFKFVPKTEGKHLIGPFAFEIDRFRLRSNSVEVVAFAKPKPEVAIMQIVPSRTKIRMGETVTIRVEPGGRAGNPRLKPAPGYAVVSSTAGNGITFYVLKPTRTGSIHITPANFEDAITPMPFFGPAIEVLPAAPAENPALPAPPKVGDEATEAGLPPETF